MSYYALDTYEAEADQTDFTITFDYLNAEHLVVVHEEVTLEYGVDWTLSAPTTVTLTVAAEEGDVVTIRRETSPASRLVDWSAGAVISETDLDLESYQLLYLVQEVYDAMELLEVEGAEAPVVSVFGRTGAVVAAADDYAVADITGLVAALGGKSDSGHDHDADYSAIGHDHDADYSAIGHNHTGVYSLIDHNHSGVYSPTDHNHDGVYSVTSHDHDSDYSAIGHDHSGVYSPVGHDHDGDYSALGHDHSGTYVPTTLSVSGGTSLTGGGTLSENRTLTLLNDEATPGNDKVYGTGPTGTKGWFDKASGGSGATQLDELSDVNTSTPTNRNVLVADGIDWESRALVEADISDFGSYALATHDHDSDYADIAHDHDLDYADIAHDHSGVYSPVGHDHDSDYADINHNHDLDYADIAHDHSGVYSPVAHDHSGVYSPVAHDHSGVYSPVGHDHDSDYAALSHAHGNITNAGAIGSTSGLPIKTGTSGVLQVGAFGTGSGDFAEGDHTHSGVYSPVGHTHTLSNITDAGDCAALDVITAVYIDTGACTETKIGSGAVTETKIGTGAVTEGKLGTGAVTEGKIGTGAVTAAKLATAAYAPRTFTVANVATSYTLTAQADHDLTLTAATQFTLPTPSSNSTAIVCFARIIDGGYTVSYADSITWAGGSAPDFSTHTWAWVTFRIVKNSSGTVSYFGAINGYDS